MENLLGQRPRRESISIAPHDRSRLSFSWTPMSARPFAVGGSVNRRTVPWFRIHPAESRVGQALHLVIASTPSNGA